MEKFLKKISFKQKIIAVGFVLLTCSWAVVGYDSSFVTTTTVGYSGSDYTMLWMKRGESNKKIKAKYFAAKDAYNGNSVPERFNSWSRGKNVICFTSGTYMSDLTASKAGLIGLTVDNGTVVNNTVESNLDALIIVYATGGVVASNLDDKNLKVTGSGLTGVELDIRGNAYHRQKFLKWAKENKATVFQTHLLAMNNVLKLYSNGSKRVAERRFLAVGYDENGKVVHTIVHDPNPSTLYDASKKVLSFLTDFQEMNVIWMINLDTGAQNVFGLYDANGNKNSKIEGRVSISNSRNLLVYYE